MVYIKNDPRFYVISDGRIVLTEHFTGDAKLLEPFPWIENIDAALEEALAVLPLRTDGVFTISTLNFALDKRGHQVRPDQFDQILERLRHFANVEFIRPGLYRIPPSRKNGLKRKPVSDLDFMIKEGMRHSRRRRR
jgi:hypothetical protein